MPNLTLESGLHALAFSRRALLGLLNDIPREKYTYQPVPRCNHVLWVLGHLAWTDDYFVYLQTGTSSALSDEWNKSMGMGSTPVADAAAYPPIATVMDKLAERREALLGWFKSLTPSQLAAPITGNLAQFAPTFAALMSSLAWHEGLHSGQISVIRKALGLQPAFG